MAIPEPFTVVALSASIIANLATDILKHHTRNLESTLAGQMLKWAGLTDPDFNDRLRETVAASINLFFNRNPDYCITGVISFLSDAEVANQISNFILNHEPVDIQSLNLIFIKHLGNDAVSRFLLDKRKLREDTVVPHFLDCYREVLRRQLATPQMAIMLEIVDQGSNIIDEIKASEARIKGFIADIEARNTVTAFDHEAPFSIDAYISELDRIYAAFSIENRYVPLDGIIRTEDDNKSYVVDVDKFIDGWLTDKERHHLAVLGDYGTGKSWLCLRLTKRLIDLYRVSPDQFPLPLLITFRHYRKGVDLLELIKLELFDGYGVVLQNPALLRRMLQSGGIFPILDGMDEMAKELGEKTAIVAFSRLGLASQIPKVIVTCRTHFFYSNSEERKILNPERASALIADAPKFELLHLELLDRSKVIHGISCRFSSIETARVLKFVDANYNLAELCARPVLLSLVCDTYNLLGEGCLNPTSSVELYEAYTDAWLQRELKEGRLIIDPELIKWFFEDLAHHMVLRDTLILRSDSFRSEFAAFLTRINLSIEKWSESELERQLITSTFIKRSVLDGWEFSHRSFQEFFYARKFFRWESDSPDKQNFPVIHIPIWQFIAEMTLKRWDKQKALQWIKPRIDRTQEQSLSLTTLRASAAYWLLKRGASPANQYPLSGIMLDSVDLHGLDFSGCDLSNADLHRSNLREATLSSANLANSILIETDMQSAVLINAVMRAADCSYASFREADLSFADLRDTLLEGANFAGTNLKWVKITGARISFAEFRGAVIGDKDSEEWQNFMTQLRECVGYETAKV